MSENAKKLKEEKKLGNLRERLKEVGGQASAFDIKALKESIKESMEKIKEFESNPATGDPRRKAPSKETLEKLKSLVPAEEKKMEKQKKFQELKEKKPGVGFPVLRFDENGKPITGGVKPKLLNKGGAVRKGDSEAVQKYKHGGEVKKKKSKVAGRLAQRGYGKARK
jgi:hypothetical protein